MPLWCCPNRRGGSNEEKAQATQLRCEALRLLPPFLALPDAQSKCVLAALGEVQNDIFPVRSRELTPGSTQVCLLGVHLFIVTSLSQKLTMSCQGCKLPQR